MDLVLAVCLLPVLVPVRTIFWAIVRRDGAAVFSGHTRVSQHGKAFSSFQSRTMVAGTNDKLVEYLNENLKAAREWAKTQKLTNHPRITSAGQFWDKISLDVLPQVWNMLKCEMSFVGPRPVTAPELEHYGVHRESYLAKHPCTTSVWQVNGRSDGDYIQRVQLDNSNVQSCSFKFEMVLKTAGVVTNVESAECVRACDHRGINRMLKFLTHEQ